LPVLSIEALDFTDELDLPTPEALAPWQVNPSRLTSWYEMVNFSARAFFFCGRALRQLKMECLLGSVPKELEEATIFHVTEELDERTKVKAIESLTFVEREFRAIGLGITADTVKDIINALQAANAILRNFQWLNDQVTTIEKLVERELTHKVFLYITPEKSRFFPVGNNPYPLTEAVFKAFPSATYDTNEAAWSLALDRSTAAVFHLMRILEIALSELGKVFGVSLAHTNWGNALDQIEAKIRIMHTDPVWKAKPDCKEQQEFYAQAASHFGILKDAWRNYTMHIRAKYTEDEAEQIFATVKAFMVKLSERISETP